MKFNSSFTITVYFLCYMATGFSCKRNNSVVAENVVYYYPENNIYYDASRSNYYYSLNGGRSWDSMVFKGTGYGAVLGHKVSLERTGNKVWENNEKNRKDYNGVLLNIVNNQTISLSKADSISKIKAIAVVKSLPEVIAKEEPPKKGLRKFFNNLFGKKKKPAGENNQ